MILIKVKLQIYLKIKNLFLEILKKTFQHRSWNHLCWSFTGRTGINKTYLNGELQGSFTIDSDYVRKGVLGTDEVDETLFIVGQEPDGPSLRNGFDIEQVFVGDITELNMWMRNYTLAESEFHLKNFPFEEGTCNFILMINVKCKYNKATLLQ